LIIDPQHTQVPYTQFLIFGPIDGYRMPDPYYSPCTPALCVNFFDLKAQYFQPKGNQPWHYTIFGDSGLSPDPVGPVGGYAQIPGYNFMVTQGHINQLKCFLGTQLDVCQNWIAGTFMHELGHNLGLRHGGDENLNYKINYVSVMNYYYQSGIPYIARGDTYQFSTLPLYADLPVADVQHIVGLRVDYSGTALPTLDESHLDERIGLGGPADSTDVTDATWCAFPPGFACPGGRSGILRVAAAPIDWNTDGIIESDVGADINFWFASYFIYRIHGYDDWTHIQQFLRTPEYVTGTLRSSEVIWDVRRSDSWPTSRR
jgi:hypothetical protein